MEQADIATTEPDMVPPLDLPASRVVCLHDTTGANDWFEDQVELLNAFTWDVAEGQDLEPNSADSLTTWVAAANKTIEGMTTEPVHIIASTKAAFGAITLAAENPNKIKSLILGDPDVDPTQEGYAETLKKVIAPTLVIAASPEKDTDFTGAQSIAGGIDNGVFVIIHDTKVPSHQTRSSSFNEWASSFMEIADGLYIIRQQEGATQ